MNIHTNVHILYGDEKENRDKKDTNSEQFPRHCF